MAQRTTNYTQPQSRLDAERERVLAPAVPNSRARVAELPQSYTVAPRSTFDRAAAAGAEHRPIGASGIEAFRKMTQKPKRR